MAAAAAAAAAAAVATHPEVAAVLTVCGATADEQAALMGRERLTELMQESNTIRTKHHLRQSKATGFAQNARL